MPISRRTMIAVFESRKALIAAVDELAEADLLNIERTAVVAKAKDGETVVVDNHISPNEAGIAGGTLGAAMTVLGMTQLGALVIPGVGPLVSIGAGVLLGGMIGRQTGRIAANMLNQSFDEQQLQMLSDSLNKGQAALIVEADTEQALAKVRQALTKLETQISVIERMADLSNSSA